MELLIPVKQQMMKNNSTTIAILLVCVVFVVCSTQMRLYCILCWISESRSLVQWTFLFTSVKQTTTGTAFCSVPPIIFCPCCGVVLLLTLPGLPNRLLLYIGLFSVASVYYNIVLSPTAFSLYITSQGHIIMSGMVGPFASLSTTVVVSSSKY